ncbi:hypothetical protein FRB93_010506 [Tulasnella sp. JGI-2019a]|nr:hypothetical protein FRB93_010506 [Tulasnella sp. JGI-2019a]
MASFSHYSLRLLAIASRAAIRQRSPNPHRVLETWRRLVISCEEAIRRGDINSWRSLVSSDALTTIIDLLYDVLPFDPTAKTTLRALRCLSETTFFQDSHPLSFDDPILKLVVSIRERGPRLIARAWEHYRQFAPTWMDDGRLSILTESLVETFWLMSYCDSDSPRLLLCSSYGDAPSNYRLKTYEPNPALIDILVMHILFSDWRSPTLNHNDVFGLKTIVQELSVISSYINFLLKAR